MIASKMQNAVNEQINAELYSAYLYLAMAAYFEDQNLKGMAHWMEKQAAEEYAHAKKFYDFIFERGGRVTLKAIDAPPAAWKSPLDVFREAYAHEQKVTSLIYKLVELAAAEKDHAASVLLDCGGDRRPAGSRQGFRTGVVHAGRQAGPARIASPQSETLLAMPPGNAVCLRRKV
jgi:ferritin